jgi:hypothetical protein
MRRVPPALHAAPLFAISAERSYATVLTDPGPDAWPSFRQAPEHYG